MDDRLLLVQFIHPGSEHRLDASMAKGWNKGDHARKFLVVPGCCERDGTTHAGEVAFWGEWEPPSRLVRAFGDSPENRSERFPRYVVAPILERPSTFEGMQNTDPCVFGGFFYTGCQQRATNSLRWLAPGSVILFGSHLGRGLVRKAFVLDTVFVVGDYIDHDATSFREALRNKVPEEYFTTTLEPWYWGSAVSSEPEVGYRLYRGATREAPVNGMFSFFPAIPWLSQVAGFPRPRITHAIVADGKTQGYKQTPATLEGAAIVWNDIRDQVIGAGLWLGTAAAMPPATVLSTPIASGAD